MTGGPIQRPMHEPSTDTTRARLSSRGVARQPIWRRLHGVLVHGVRASRHEWTLAVCAGLGLAVVMFWESVRHPASTVPADIWDPTLQAWQMAWAGHIVKSAPSMLWNANGFFPEPYSFAFSDTLLGYLPASFLGNGPGAALVRYNALFLLVHALAFTGAYALIRQLGAGKLAAAVAGVAFAYAPWRWGQAGHMHVLSVGGIALALAMLARGHGFSLRAGARMRRRVRPRWAFAGWCVAAWQMSLGFGIGIPFAYVLAGICAATAVGLLVGVRPAPGRRIVLADGFGLLVFAAVTAFMAYPYLKVIQLHPEARRDIHVIEFFSPTWRSFLTAPAGSRLWGGLHAPARATMGAPAETALLPGFALYAMALAGLIWSTWTVRTRLVLLGGLVFSLYLAMGLNAPFDGDLGFRLLHDFAPGWDALRTPGRLVIWSTLLLTLLAAGAIDELVNRTRKSALEKHGGRLPALARLTMLIPLALVLAEGTNSLEHPVVPAQPAAMRTLAGPLLVLPSDDLTDQNVMLWSTTRFQQLVNGGSGFPPDSQARTRRVARSFPDARSVRYLRRLGIKNVLVLKNDMTNPGNHNYARAADTHISIDGLGLTRVDAGDVFIYTFKSVDARTPPS